ncbi:hypothetical protein KIPB_003118, partial [Kipferlia bialata]
GGSIEEKKAIYRMLRQRVSETCYAKTEKPTLHDWDSAYSAVAVDQQSVIAAHLARLDKASEEMERGEEERRRRDPQGFLRTAVERDRETEEGERQGLRSIQEALACVKGERQELREGLARAGIEGDVDEGVSLEDYADQREREMEREEEREREREYAAPVSAPSRSRVKHTPKGAGRPPSNAPHPERERERERLGASAHQTRTQRPTLSHSRSVARGSLVSKAELKAALAKAEDEVDAKDCALRRASAAVEQLTHQLDTYRSVNEDNVTRAQVSVAELTASLEAAVERADTLQQERDSAVERATIADTRSNSSLVDVTRLVARVEMLEGRDAELQRDIATRERGVRERQRWALQALSRAAVRRQAWQGVTDSLCTEADTNTLSQCISAWREALAVAALKSRVQTEADLDTMHGALTAMRRVAKASLLGAACTSRHTQSLTRECIARWRLTSKAACIHAESVSTHALDAWYTALLDRRQALAVQESTADSHLRASTLRSVLSIWTDSTQRQRQERERVAACEASVRGVSAATLLSASITGWRERCVRVRRARVSERHVCARAQHTLLLNAIRAMQHRHTSLHQAEREADVFRRRLLKRGLDTLCAERQKCIRHRHQTVLADTLYRQGGRLLLTRAISTWRREAGVSVYRQRTVRRRVSALGERERRRVLCAWRGALSREVRQRAVALAQQVTALEDSLSVARDIRATHALDASTLVEQVHALNRDLAAEKAERKELERGVSAARRSVADLTLSNAALERERDTQKERERQLVAELRRLTGESASRQQRLDETLVAHEVDVRALRAEIESVRDAKGERERERDQERAGKERLQRERERVERERDMQVEQAFDIAAGLRQALEDKVSEQATLTSDHASNRAELTSVMSHLNTLDRDIHTQLDSRERQIETLVGEVERLRNGEKAETVPEAERERESDQSLDMGDLAMSLPYTAGYSQGYNSVVMGGRDSATARPSDHLDTGRGAYTPHGLGDSMPKVHSTADSAHSITGGALYHTSRPPASALPPIPVSTHVGQRGREAYAHSGGTDPTSLSLSAALPPTASRAARGGRASRQPSSTSAASTIGTGATRSPLDDEIEALARKIRQQVGF